MNKFTTIVCLLITTAFAGLSLSIVFNNYEIMPFFLIAGLLLFPLVFGVFTFCSQRSIFISRRLFWIISFVVATAVWILLLSGLTCSSHFPEASFSLWQRPRIFYESYLYIFSHWEGVIPVSFALLTLLLPVMGVLSALHIWLLSRRHTENTKPAEATAQ